MADDQETITLDDLEADGGAVVGGRRVLLVYHGDGTEVLPLARPATIEIGRAVGGGGLSLADGGLSRRHARVEVTEELTVTVEDLGSKNGTWIGGARIAGPRDVGPGDEVRLGSVVLALLETGGRPPLGVASHELFLRGLEQQVVRSLRGGAPLALALLSAEGAPIERWYPALQRHLDDGDRVGLYAPGMIEVAFAASDSARASERCEALVAAAQQPPLRCGVALLPEVARSAEALVSAARAALQRATAAAPLSRATAARETAAGEPDLVVASGALRRLLEQVKKVARATVPVLLVGETGTGKELVARAIHAGSPRAAGPLCCLNCGAIPEQLVESELFGHERGAFTGAGERRAGLFERGDGGTVLLDEIGELPPAAQAALLRVLEDKRLRCVGGAEETSVDVRVLAATNRDLELMCDEGGFRRDLLFRLNTVTLEVPPLRARREAIARLAQHFLERARREQGAAVRRIAPAAVDALRRYDWPGNARELRNVIERAAVLAEGEEITVDDLTARVRSAGGDAAAEEVGGQLEFKARMQRYEEELILEALERAGWNQTAAARALRMPLRTMVRKIQAYGLSRRGR